jgi:HlyD family secretion protein
MLARVRSHLVGNKVISLIRRHKRIAIGVAVILVILIIIFRPKGPASLETVTVKENSIVESLTASGTVQAEDSVNLTFLAPGKVTFVGVKEGDIVEKGQTIAVVDQRTAQKTMENALRDYAKQRNTFESTRDENQNLTPQTSRDSAMRRVLENNQNDLEKAVTSVELQDIVKQNAVLVSPINGVVLRADVTVPGVNAGATTTYTVADPDTLQFELDVDEADVGRVVLGQSVKVILEAYPEQEIYGTIEDIAFASHKTDTGGNAFTVKVSLPIQAVTYRIGMNGDAEVILAQKSNTLTVPLSALIDEQYVYVKQKDDKFEKRQVKIGLQSDTDAEIISGLATGEVVTIQPEEAEKRNAKR